MSDETENFVQQFMRELGKSDPAPELLALYVAGMNYPHLNIEKNLGLLDDISATVYDALSAEPQGRARAELFLSVLSREWRFSGNRSRYYDPRNSFFNDVLERRTGLPITLSLLCIAVGRRLEQRGLELAVNGIGLPGHFMASYRDNKGEWLLDPFNGKVLVVEEASAHLTDLFQQPVRLTAKAFQPVSTTMLIFRMLNNLRLLYLDATDYAATIGVLDYMIILRPNDSELWKERGLLHYYTENWESTSRDLRRYFYLQGLLLFALGAIDENGLVGLDEDELTFPMLDEEIYDLDDQAGELAYGNIHDDEDKYAGDDYAEADDAEIDDEESDEEVELESAMAELSAENQQLLQILGEVEELRTRLN